MTNLVGPPTTLLGTHSFVGGHTPISSTSEKEGYICALGSKHSSQRPALPDSFSTQKSYLPCNARCRHRGLVPWIHSALSLSRRPWSSSPTSDTAFSRAHTRFTSPLRA